MSLSVKSIASLSYTLCISNNSILFAVEGRMKVTYARRSHILNSRDFVSCMEKELKSMKLKQV